MAPTSPAFRPAAASPSRMVRRHSLVIALKRGGCNFRSTWCANCPWRGMSTSPPISTTAMPDITTNLATPARALAIAAHPDDVEFGCGGTLAKWAAQGCSILHLICTDGSKGTWDADADLTHLVATRQAEQRGAARVLGGTEDVVFLGWHDG